LARDRLADAVTTTPHQARGEHLWVVTSGPAGERVPRGTPEGLPFEPDLALVARDGRARQSEVEVCGRIFFVRTVRRGDEVLQAIMDQTAAEEASGRLALSLLAAGGVGVVLAAAVAAVLARRTLEPVSEALRMQRRFVSDASHELRTPLTLLSTRVQVLARRLQRGPEVPADVREDLAGVLEDTAALTGILDDLLLAAAPAGAASRARCDVRDLVGSVTAAAAASARDRGVSLRTGRLEEAVVDGSPVALRRAVTSLVDNALDHAGSQVTVEVRAGRRHVDVRVTDDGPGVPPEVARRMFERFSSSRAGSAAGADGRRHYGLGLALVADVAAAHHGSVTVSPAAEGPGTVLVLTLPRVAGLTTGK